MPVSSLRLGVAERADIVVDFSTFPLGSQLTLRNRLVQTSGRGPRDDPDELLDPGVPVLRFDVVVLLAAPDLSRVPSALRPLQPLAELLADVDNEIFDPLVPLFSIKRGATELWELESNGNWHHPVHLHLEESRIVSRNGQPPPSYEAGRKDVVIVGPSMKITR